MTAVSGEMPCKHCGTSIKEVCDADHDHNDLCCLCQDDVWANDIVYGSMPYGSIEEQESRMTDIMLSIRDEDDDGVE